MQSERLSSERVRDSARFVATELVREPIKIAVRDALREEAEIERATGERTAARAEDGTERTPDDADETTEYGADETAESSGRSRRFWVGFLVSAAGVAYLARRRMSRSSSWSDGLEDTGYSTEGEMQTGETAGEDVTPADGGHSPTTER